MTEGDTAVTAIQAIHPPSAEAAAAYRHDGYWLEARTVAEHGADLASGGDRVALEDNDSGWTYHQLTGATLTVRRMLTAAGVGVGDTVLIIASMRNLVVAGYLATLNLGAVAMMLDRKVGVAEVRNAVMAAPPRIAITFDDDIERLGLDQHCPVLSLDSFQTVHRHTGIDDKRRLDPDIPAAVVFTSGTTSAPKGVVHTLNSLRCGAANMTAALEVTAEDAFFLPTPLASITGLLQLHSAIALHAKLILEERFSAHASLNRLCAHGATIVGGAPVIMQALFDESIRQKRTTLPLRCIAVGGSMIPPDLLVTAQRFAITPVRVYGSSEVPFSCSNTLGTDVARHDDGGPLPGVEVSIDEARHELLVRGPHRFHGYLLAAHNVEAFRGDWVRTGDQAVEDAGRITITGRLKEVAIRKGMKISLAEIDTAASGLGECAAYGLPDDVTGERVALAVYADAGAGLTLDSVVAHLLAAGLAKWKLPEQIVLWDRPLPRTESGKVSRRRVAELGADLPAMFAHRLVSRGSRSRG